MTYWKLFIANKLHYACGFILIPLIGVTVDSYKNDANYIPTMWFAAIELILLIGNWFYLKQVNK